MNVSILQNSFRIPRAIAKTALPERVLIIHRHNSQDVVERPASFVDEDLIEKEKIEKPASFFNKSRLSPQHRNFLRGKVPYTEPKSPHHLTVKYQRKMFGQFGLASNIDPRICFSTKEDIELREEYERIAYPYTLQEIMQKVKLENEAKQQAIRKRDEDIAKKIEKLEQWKQEVKSKIAKKEADAIAAKEKKERIVEEVRRHFGFKIDPRDERFKELLEQKEKEDKKKLKEAKKKAKEEKMMARIVESTKEKVEPSEKSTD